MKTMARIRNKKLVDVLLHIRKEVIHLLGDKVREIILYGSYARGEQQRDSDLDVMVLIDGDTHFLQKYRYPIAERMADVSLQHDIVIGITEELYQRYNDYKHVMPFYKNIEKEGVEIYERKSA